MPLEHGKHFFVPNQIHDFLIHKLAVQLGQIPTVPDHQLVKSPLVLQVHVFQGKIVGD